MRASHYLATTALTVVLATSSAVAVAQSLPPGFSLTPPVTASAAQPQAQPAQQNQVQPAAAPLAGPAVNLPAASAQAAQAATTVAQPAAASGPSGPVLSASEQLTAQILGGSPAKAAPAASVQPAAAPASTPIVAPVVETVRATETVNGAIAYCYRLPADTVRTWEQLGKDGVKPKVVEFATELANFSDMAEQQGLPEATIELNRGEYKVPFAACAKKLDNASRIAVKIVGYLNVEDADAGGRHVLAVDITTPSTRTIDLALKSTELRKGGFNPDYSRNDFYIPYVAFAQIGPRGSASDLIPVTSGAKGLVSNAGEPIVVTSSPIPIEAAGTYRTVIWAAADLTTAYPYGSKVDAPDVNAAAYSKFFNDNFGMSIRLKRGRPGSTLQAPDPDAFVFQRRAGSAVNTSRSTPAVGIQSIGAGQAERLVAPSAPKRTSMETTPVNPSKPAETQPVIAADNGSDAAGSGGSDISSRRPSRAVSSAPASSDVDLDMIKDAQGKLNALGFDAGTVDGKTGPRTRAAVKAFQAAAAVKVTGRIDAKLITQLDDALAGRLPLNRNSSPVQTSLSVVFGRDDLFGGYRFDAATMRIIGEAIGQSAERVQVGDKGMWSDTEPSGAHGTILMVGDASQVCQGRGQFGRTLTLTSTLPAGMVIEASGVSVCQTGPHAWLVL